MSSDRRIALIGAELHGAADSRSIANATVVIEDGRIAAVGSGLPPPAGARVIDAAGKVATPGLMNAGTHLGLVEIGAIADSSDQVDKEAGLGAGFDVRYALNANSTLLPLARADGLTRALTYPGPTAKTPFSGLAAILRLSEGPDILDKPAAALIAAIGLAGTDLAEASRAARWILLRRGLDEAKAETPAKAPLADVISGVTPLAIVAAREGDVRQAVALGSDYGVRVVVLGGAEAWRAADVLAKHDVAVILNPFDDLPASYDEIGACAEAAAILHQAGVRIAFSVPGIHFSHDAGAALREAAGLAVAAGLSWADALAALTTGPAKIFGIDDRYGMIAEGLDADLVIWDGDPLEPSSRPTTVFVRGLEASLATRQSLLAQRYHPRRRDDPWPPAYR
jgi:imidazolonepropionase-like amidohydrolase